MKKGYLLFFCIYCIVSNLHSQEIDNVTALKTWELKAYAASAVRERDPLSAIAFIKQLHENDPQNTKYVERLADLYFQIRNYTTAYKLYNGLIEMDKDKFAQVYSKLGYIQMAFGDYDEAGKCFSKAIHHTKDKEIKEMLKIARTSCKNNTTLIDSSNQTSISLLDSFAVNTTYPEFFTHYLNDSVIVFGRMEYRDTLESDYDLVRRYYFMSSKDSAQKTVKKVDSIPWNYFNNFDKSGACLSLDKKRFYLTKCEKNWMYKTVCKLYVSKKENNGWSAPQKLGKSINQNRYTTSQPSVGNCYNPNLEVVYFSSDRPGGAGGMDLWYAIYDKKKDKYFRARNVGFSINTAGDEITPFYDVREHMLYYSSNNKFSLGGFDIYKVYGELVNWEESVNLAWPINSSYDDVYYSHKNKYEGLLCSNRPEGESYIHKNNYDNIYQFKIDRSDFITIKGVLNKDQFLGFNTTKYSRDTTKQVLGNTVLSLYLVDENRKDPILLTQDTTTVTGDFSFEVSKGNSYMIKIEDNSVLNNELLIDSLDIVEDNELVVEELKLVTIEADSAIALDNLYYGFNESELSDSALRYLDSTLFIMLEEYKGITIEIGSHTDNVGSKRYNARLSQLRADKIVNYLVDKGIEKDRLVAKGYGETKPIAPNEDKDGHDNPEGRKRNRRTEFTILDKAQQ